jgi:hypothetical protein
MPMQARILRSARDARILGLNLIAVVEPMLDLGARGADERVVLDGAVVVEAGDRARPRLLRRERVLTALNRRPRLPNLGRRDLDVVLIDHLRPPEAN